MYRLKMSLFVGKTKVVVFINLSCSKLQNLKSNIQDNFLSGLTENKVINVNISQI